MFNIGTQELLLLLLVVLILFGAKRVPEVSRALGKGLGDLRDALSGVEKELKGEVTRSPGPRTALPPGLPRDPLPAAYREPGPAGVETTTTPRPRVIPQPPPAAHGSAPATSPDPGNRPEQTAVKHAPEPKAGTGSPGDDPGSGI